MDRMGQVGYKEMGLGEGASCYFTKLSHGNNAKCAFEKVSVEEIETLDQR